MHKRAVHFIVDTFAFVALVGMISTGFVLRFILPPGSGRLIGEGTGVRSAEKSIGLLWGLTRHEWGNVHFWISTGLMALMVVHLVLHWRWIAGVIGNQPKEHSGVRFGLGLVGLVTIIVFAVSPLLSPTQHIPRSRTVQEGAAATQTPILLRNKGPVRGSMTLEDVEKQTGTPVDVILKKLELPANISPHSHLGRLSRVYGFDLEEVHKIVDEYEKTNSEPE